MSDPTSTPGSRASDARSSDTLHRFSEALANAADFIAPSIVAVHARRRIPATGVVWRSGYVIASDHTIRRDENITVSFHDGRTVDASLVGRDHGTDLALLKINDTMAPIPARYDANAAALRAGLLVLAVGRPGSSLTSTLGSIHSVGGDWKTWQGGLVDQLIRLDIDVHDGYSGSAAVDARGLLIGINSSMLTRGTPAVLPNATVDRVVDLLLTGGKAPKGWLGIGTQPIRLTEKVRADTGLSQDVGLLVVNVASDSPAERAGIFVGDTLIALAGTATREAEDVLAILSPETVNRTLTARIIRAGALMEIPVVVGQSTRSESKSRGAWSERCEPDGDDDGARGFGAHFHHFGPFVYGIGRKRGPRSER